MKQSVGFGKIILAVLLSVLLFSSAAKSECKKEYGSGSTKIVLATGSPGELGLLEALATAFNKKHDVGICWQKASSGKSLMLLKEKKADIVMVHAPAAEKKAVKEGWAIKRTLLGSNEFYIVGPKNDPAGIAEVKSASDAYARIAKVKAAFISRGDNSGTNKKELGIWKKAGINPEGEWYIITKDFMMASLIKANGINGYFMTDSSTWVAGKKNLNNLKILFRNSGDSICNFYLM